MSPAELIWKEESNMFYRQFIILALSIVMLGCVGSSSDNKDGPLVLGTITSFDMEYINVDASFDLLVVEVASDNESNNIQQIILSINDNDSPSDLTEQASNVAIWAFVIRTQANPIGIYQAEDIEVKLFRGHSRSNANNDTDLYLFKDRDVADITYVGISGWISFDSVNDTTYEVQFQQETNTELGLTSGPVVTVSGSIVNLESLDSLF